MPTFQSIGLHPDLRSRLVSVSETSSSSTAKMDTATVRPDSQGAHARSMHLQAIETPQALLSRNPESLHLSLSEMQDVPITQDHQQLQTRPFSREEANQLRCHVAEALMNQSNTGRYLHFMATREVHTSHANDEDEESLCSGGMQISGVGANNRNKRKTSHPQTRVSRSVLDMVSHQSSLQTVVMSGHERDLSLPQFISTGCPSLDKLLTLPPEYTLITTYSHPTTTSGSSLSGKVAGDPLDESKGLCRGYVTQLCGRPSCGKTQLALHLAIKAASLFRNAVTASTKGSSIRYGNIPLVESPCVYYFTSQDNPAILAGRLSNMQRKVRRNNKKLLNNISISLVSSDLELLNELAELEERILNIPTHDDENSTGSNKNNGIHQSEQAPLLLVLDSASGCLSSSGEDRLGRVARTLRRWARNYHVAVLITNGVTSSSWNYSGSASTADTLVTLEFPHRNQYKPSLGRSWNDEFDFNLWLEESGEDTGENATTIVATIEKSPINQDLYHSDDILGNQNRSAIFHITGGGIHSSLA